MEEVGFLREAGDEHSDVGAAVWSYVGSAGAGVLAADPPALGRVISREGHLSGGSSVLDGMLG